MLSFSFSIIVCYLQLQCKSDNIGLENHILDKPQVITQCIRTYVDKKQQRHISARVLNRVVWDSSNHVRLRLQAASKITGVLHIRPRHFWLTFTRSPTVETQTLLPSEAMCELNKKHWTIWVDSESITCAGLLRRFLMSKQVCHCSKISCCVT